jgi:hypothetical protein
MRKAHLRLGLAKPTHATKPRFSDGWVCHGLCDDAGDAADAYQLQLIRFNSENQSSRSEAAQTSFLPLFKLALVGFLVVQSIQNRLKESGFDQVVLCWLLGSSVLIIESQMS